MKEKKKKDKFTSTDKIAIGLIGVGIIGALTLPYILTQLDWVNRFLCISFGHLEANEIGDMIGGIIGPFIGLISASLVYLTIREQINANASIQKQFKSEQDFRYEKAIFDEVIKDINKIVEGIDNISGASLNEKFKSFDEKVNVSIIANEAIFDTGVLDYKFKEKSEILYFKVLFQRFVLSLELFSENIKNESAFYKIVELKIEKVNLYIENSLSKVKSFNSSDNIEDFSSSPKL